MKQRFLYPQRAANSLPLVSLRLPFLQTPPVTDIGLLLILFPLWWVLGIEQFVWPVGFGLICLKTVVQQGFHVRLNATLRWLLLFLSVHLISGLFIVESFRWLTFARNFGAYVAIFCLILVIVNQVRSWRQIRFLLYALTILMVATGLVGLLSIAGIWRTPFPSLLGQIMPGWIRATSYGGQIAQRSLGQLSWFIGLNIYFRVSGMFMYSTLYASALALTMPIALFLARWTGRATGPLIFGSVAGLLLLNLVYTTGRIAMIGLLAGGLYYVTFLSRWRTWIKLMAVITLATLLTVTLFSLMLTGDFLLPVQRWYNEFVFARGAGSFQDRSFVYEVTLSQFLQRPVFGWGTERDIPNFVYPAGSHSYYLAILYKQGLVGILVFLAMWWSIWRETRPLRFAADSADERALDGFLRYGRWTLAAALVNSLTDVLDLDATTLVVLGLIIGLLIKARDLRLQARRNHYENQLQHSRRTS